MSTWNSCKTKNWQPKSANYIQPNFEIRLNKMVGLTVGLCYLFVRSYVRSFITRFAPKSLKIKHLSYFNVRSWGNYENSFFREPAVSEIGAIMTHGKEKSLDYTCIQKKVVYLQSSIGNACTTVYDISPSGGADMIFEGINKWSVRFLFKTSLKLGREIDNREKNK